MARAARFRRVLVMLAALVLVGAPWLVWGQRRSRGWSTVQEEANVPYDGRFTFARLRYQVYERSG